MHDFTRRLVYSTICFSVLHNITHRRRPHRLLCKIRQKMHSWEQCAVWRSRHQNLTFRPCFFSVNRHCRAQFPRDLENFRLKTALTLDMLTCTVNGLKRHCSLIDIALYTLYNVFLSRKVPFGEHDEAALHLGGKIPKKAILAACIVICNSNSLNIKTFVLSKVLHQFQPYLTNTGKYCLWEV